jgi:hypothetical protein
MTFEPHPSPAHVTDLSQLPIPGVEGLWPDAVLVSEDMLSRLLQADDRQSAEELIPLEIAVNPHQLALELEHRQPPSEC